MWKIAFDVLKDAASTADIEDCVSEVFYKLWKKPGLFDFENEKIKNYLARMTRNTAIDMLRKRSREKNETLDENINDGIHTDDVIETVLKNEEKEALYQILDTMNERDKELILRRFFENQKPAQISEEMQIPLREVNNRIYRIKADIRGKMS